MTTRWARADRNWGIVHSQHGPLLDCRVCGRATCASFEGWTDRCRSCGAHVRRWWQDAHMFRVMLDGSTGLRMRFDDMDELREFVARTGRWEEERCSAATLAG